MLELPPVVQARLVVAIVVSTQVAAEGYRYGYSVTTNLREEEQRR